MSSKKIGHAQERAQVPHRLGRRHLLNGFHLRPQRRHALGRDDKAEELNRRPEQFRFGTLGQKLVLPQRCQNRLHLEEVFHRISRGCENADIITINDAVPRRDMLLQHVIHKPLESTGRRAQPKRRRDPLILAIRHHEGRLVTIRRSDIELVKTRLQIHLGKHFSSSCTRNEILRSGRWKSIPHGLQVKSPIIHTKTELAILLGRKQNRGAVLAQTAPNDARLQKHIKLPLEFGNMLRCNLVRSTMRRRQARLEIDLQIQQARRWQARHSTGLKDVGFKHAQTAHNRVHHGRRGPNKLPTDFSFHQSKLIWHRVCRR